MCDQTALNSEMLCFMALSLDVLFFFDADAVFLFLEVVKREDGDFVDGFGCGAL
jgi:hypothetical protein